MKKVLLTMCAALAINCAMDQDKPLKDNSDSKIKLEKIDKKPQQRPDRTEMMTRELNLTPEQTEKVKELNEKYPELMRMRPHRGGPRPGGFGEAGPRQDKDQKVDGTTGATAQQQPMQRPSREEMEKRMQERKQKQEAYDAELKKILTEEQFEKYEKSKPQPGQFRQGHGPRH